MDYTKNYKFSSEVSLTFLHKILPLIKGKRLIDLGCGQGDYLSYFSKDSVGLDISPENIKLGKKRGLNIRSADMNNPPRIRERFETVLNSHLIEHLENPRSFLRYTKMLLKKGSTLVLSIPNEHCYIGLRYPYFNGRGNHLYSFSVQNMIELLEQVGYEVKGVYRDYYTALTKKIGINPLLGLVDYSPSFVKNYLAWSFWFVAVKK